MPSAQPELATERLVLRRWREADREPFAALNADPAVMEHFPALLTRAESDAFVDRIEEKLEANGYGLWAVQVRGGDDFIGFIGLNPVPFEAHFTPALEVGWRLTRTAWGHGYATEGGAAALQLAFESLAVDEVVSFTSTTNVRSQAVMRRLGMTHDPSDDFDHPQLPDDDRLRRHVLYRIARVDRVVSGRQ
ncbi:MAG: GNAT family N-acetyltransferase [Acidimicrobiia bacterium]|nr:GNAT family N-acetyltransferase [Acidimicrobiia bacterium]